MNLRKRKNLIISFAFIFLIFTTFSVSKDVFTTQNEQSNSYDLSAYVTSDPLYIDNDGDLIGNSTSGSGIAGDPYVIENLSIITAEDYGIYIRDTTVNFIIRNCFIESSLYGIWIYDTADHTTEIDNNIIQNIGGSGIRFITTQYANITNNYVTGCGSSGIHADYSSFAVVKNNTCTFNSNGIYGTYSDNTSYIENILHNNTQYGLYVDESYYSNATENEIYYNDVYGVFIELSLSITINNNQIYGNLWHGIFSYWDTSTVISYNTVYNNQKNGIFIQFAVDNEITNNIVYSNDMQGVYNDKSTGTLIADNIVNNDGFYFLMSSIGDYATLTVSDNTVNGKPLGFIYNIVGTVLSSNDFGQLVLVDCEGTMVKDLAISDTDYALALIGCDSVIVDNCDFSNNYGGGVVFEGTMNCTLINTICNHNPVKPGINLFGTIDTVIQNCTSSNNFYGLQIISSTNFTILNSTFNQNIITNAYLTEGAAGNIRYNAFTNAGALGLQFSNIDYVNITHNLFESNTQFAIYLDNAATGNWIHHNAFISNNLGGTSQAHDSTMGLNMWDDPWSMEGNYWDDWVSGNYTIDGLGQVNDSYPLGDIPVGVISEFNQFSLLILLLPVVFVSMVIIRKRKR